MSLYELQFAEHVYPNFLISRQGSSFDVVGDGQRKEVKLVGDG